MQRGCRPRIVRGAMTSRAMRGRVCAMRARSGRREQLLDLAAKQLNARGMSQRSLATLAASLGFTRNALYRYVEDFEDLLGQVYRRSCELLSERLSEAMAPTSPLLIVQRFVSLALDGERPEIAALNEYGLLHPQDRTDVIDMYLAVEARLARVISHGLKSGELRSCDPQLAARTIINLIHWAPLGARRGLLVDASERELAIETINGLLLVGWAADRQAPIAPPEIDLSPLIVQITDGFDQAALHEVKRETILACASRMDNSRGVETTSLDHLAAELGTTKPRLYKYVGDKTALVEACFARADKINRHILQAARELPCAPMDKLTALLRTSTAIRLNGPLEPMRYFLAGAPNPEIEPLRSRRRLLRMVENNTQLFRECQDAGAVRRFDVQGLQLINMTGGGGIIRHGDRPSVAAKGAAAEMVELLRLGLSPL